MESASPVAQGHDKNAHEKNTALIFCIGFQVKVITAKKLHCYCERDVGFSTAVDISNVAFLSVGKIHIQTSEMVWVDKNT